jgi:GNAT superfamily N-acetyltransferase
MKLTRRNFRDEEDFWRMREFLRQTLLCNDLREKSWPVMRLDYWRWHCIENCKGCESMEKVSFLWETPDGRLAAVLNPEEAGQVFLHIHPDYQTEVLEQEMISFAEKTLSIKKEGKNAIAIWADSEVSQRQAVLAGRGYTRGRWVENQWRCELDAAIPQAHPAEGYIVRSLGPREELPARSWASWRAFHPDEPREAYQGWDWYLNIQRCPLYRRDLDIVAATASDEIASFATFWYDDATRTAYIEPVGTMPEHQRRGLARAVITEGLRRVQWMGAKRAFVGGYEPAANSLYSSVLSPACDRSEQWIKEW